jgi:preprotein translocase subunit SecG
MLQNVLVIFHLVISVVLIVIVLMQQGSDQGISGAIAGGAETFFGKSKAKTIDQILKRITSIMAVLFLITSVALTLLIKA